MLQIIKNKLPILLITVAACLSTASQAGFNPFNKDKTFKFGAEVPWRVNKLGAIKSGLHKKKGNNYYYHLSVNEQRLLLRLSKNDAGGEEKNTWPLEVLDIFDVSVDKNTLPQFQWCLDNRTNPGAYPMLTMDATVKNNVCTVNISNGDFIIKLNQNSMAAIKHAEKLQITVKLGKYITTLNYSMKGFDSALSKFNSMHKVLAKKLAKKIPAKRQHATTIKAKKMVKMCVVKASAEYARTIKPVSYPCNDVPLQRKAKKIISSKIALQKRRQKEAEIALQKRKQKAEQKRQKQLEAQRRTELEKKRLQEAEKKEQLELRKREKKWEKMETSLWLNRCKKKWAIGVNPCYCQSYVEEYAPKGTSNNTCNKQ